MSDKSAISKRQLRQWMREAKSLERVITGGQVTIAELREAFDRVREIVCAIKVDGEHRFNVDQVPLPFVINTPSSLITFLVEEKGA